jgi:hypothetical protein
MSEKEYQIKVEGEIYSLSLPTIKGLLTKEAYKLWWRVHLQGGEVNLNINSIKEEVRNES